MSLLLLLGSQAASYTLTAAAGAFAVTMGSATLQVSRTYTLTASPMAYAVTLQPATLRLTSAELWTTVSPPAGVWTRVVVT